MSELEIVTTCIMGILILAAVVELVWPLDDKRK